MKETYYCSPEEFSKNSKIPLRFMKTEESMYEEIGRLMADTIKNNGDDKTVIICPVGPIAQYTHFADIVNREKISLKNCWFINMDEYLTDDDKTIAYNNPLSFHATMDRMLYSKIDPELLMPESQRLFPIPGKEKETDELFEKLGKVDICLTGVGINGHIAFNEPAEPGDDITDAEYMELGTRCMDISRETIVNNGAHKIRGALDIFPKRCITLGVKQLMKAKVLKVYLYCDWQWGIARKIALEPASRFMPASFLQFHDNAEMVITEDLYNFML